MFVFPSILYPLSLSLWKMGAIKVQVLFVDVWCHKGVGFVKKKIVFAESFIWVFFSCYRNFRSD